AGGARRARHAAAFLRAAYPPVLVRGRGGGSRGKTEVPGTRSARRGLNPVGRCPAMNCPFCHENLGVEGEKVTPRGRARLGRVAAFAFATACLAALGVGVDRVRRDEAARHDEVVEKLRLVERKLAKET